MPLPVATNNAVRTDHNACPAANTFIAVSQYNAVFCETDSAAYAGMHAGCILTVTAEYGDTI